MTLEERISKFRQIVREPEETIDLAHAALVIAAGEYPDLDIPHYLALLTEMAQAVRSRVEPDWAPPEKLAALNSFLFGELGFLGNTEFYYDPRNSYLNDVLDRRVGLPITLSVVYVEVGKRLGWPLYGVGLPGHFCCKWHDAENEIFVDPFHGGVRLEKEGLLRLVRNTFHPDAQLRSEWVRAVGPRYILARMLNNLREIFVQNDDAAHALEVLQKLLVLDPHSKENLRAAGLLSYRVGAYYRAAELLEEYLLRHPEEEDALHIRAYLRTVRAALHRMN